MENDLGNIIFDYRQKANLTQDQYGSTYIAAMMPFMTITLAKFFR